MCIYGVLNKLMLPTKVKEEIEREESLIKKFQAEPNQAFAQGFNEGKKEESEPIKGTEII